MRRIRQHEQAVGQHRVKPLAHNHFVIAHVLRNHAVWAAGDVLRVGRSLRKQHAADHPERARNQIRQQMDEQFSAPNAILGKPDDVRQQRHIQHRLAVESHHAVKPQRNAQYDARKRLPAPCLRRQKHFNHQQRQQADRQTRNIRRDPCGILHHFAAPAKQTRQQCGNNFGKTPPVQQIGADRRHRQKENARQLIPDQRISRRPVKPRDAIHARQNQRQSPNIDNRVVRSLAVVRSKASRAGMQQRVELRLFIQPSFGDGDSLGHIRRKVVAARRLIRVEQADAEQQRDHGQNHGDRRIGARIRRSCVWHVFSPLC